MLHRVTADVSSRKEENIKKGVVQIYLRIRICSGSESSNSPNKRLENTEGAIKNGQSRETDNIAYTRRRQTKHNTIQYVLDTTIHKQTQIRHELSYKQLEVKTNRTSFYAEIVTDLTTRNSERKDTLF